VLDNHPVQLFSHGRPSPLPIRASSGYPSRSASSIHYRVAVVSRKIVKMSDRRLFGFTLGLSPQGDGGPRTTRWVLRGGRPGFRVS
jgi:hypothetical protein